MAREHVMPANLAPRGLQREFAARYVGISPTTFDKMVNDGRMPKPKRIDSRKVWDLRALDMAFDRLPDENGKTTTNEWDVVLS